MQGPWLGPQSQAWVPISKLDLDLAIATVLSWWLSPGRESRVTLIVSSSSSTKQDGARVSSCYWGNSGEPLLSKELRVTQTVVLSSRTLICFHYSVFYLCALQNANTLLSGNTFVW